MNKILNKYQYNDLLIRSKDPYANAKYEIILKWLKNYNIKTILNAGCGSGELSFILAENGYTVTGIDIDKNYIDLANKNLQMLKVQNCKFETAGIENFKSKIKFDTVIATDVLEHIKDDKAAFKKLITLLKPNGIAVITVPAGQYLFGFHDTQLGHYRRYSIPDFKKIIPEEMKKREIRYFGFFLIPVAIYFSKILKSNYPIQEISSEYKNTIQNFILKLIIKIEKSISFPFGTSLLFLGKKVD